jgi:hypothetical protein
MVRLEKKTLNEITRDFLKSGVEINIESFKEWFGLRLNKKDYEIVGKKIYK